MTLSPDLPASGATFCHSSSVMNGMIGCARRSVVSSTRTSVRRVPRCCVSLPFWSCTFANSTYQSQYSSHTNSYTARAARSKRYSRNARCICSSARCRIETIQRSASTTARRERLVDPRVLALAVHQHEPRGIPELVAEISIAFAAGEVELDVAAVGRQAREGEAQRVGAEGRYAFGELAARRLLDLAGLLRVHEAVGTLLDQCVEGRCRR